MPVAAVEAAMRAGLTHGLSPSVVASFLNPGFLRGIGDPTEADASSRSSWRRTTHTLPDRRGVRRVGGPGDRRSGGGTAGPLLGVPLAQRRLRGAGGDPSVGRGRRRRHGGVGERRLSARAADHRSDPGGRATTLRWGHRAPARWRMPFNPTSTITSR